MDMYFTYDINGSEFEYSIDVTWTDIDDYFKHWGGYLPDELSSYFDIQKLIDEDEYFQKWMRERYEEAAKEKYEDEYDDRLDYCIDDAYFEFKDEDNIDIDKVSDYCKKLAEDESVSFDDVFNSVKYKLDL